MDPNQASYEDDPCIRVLNICRSVFEGYAKTYILGIPSRPLTDLDYPAVAVAKLRSSIDLGATMTDEETERIAIIIGTNRMDQAGSPNDPGITAMRELENIIEGKTPDATNPGWSDWQPNTLVYQLRKQYTLTSTVVQNAIEIEYDTNPRMDENGKPLNAITSASVTMTFTEHVLVVDRT